MDYNLAFLQALHGMQLQTEPMATPRRIKIVLSMTRAFSKVPLKRLWTASDVTYATLSQENVH